jgi:ATP-dependent phosphofructokinase / diphosphate-dependent phosphofructokinase
MSAAKKTKLGILTGGGDCAGLNAAIKWVTKTALDRRLEQERGIQYEVLGIKEGWKGLSFTGNTKQEIDDYVMPLTEETVRTWDRYGGTNLGTSRFNPYNPKADTSKTTLANIEKLGIDVLVAIGGDDTLSVAAKLHKDGVDVVGIPKTIDKDLPETDYSLGFETAVEVITGIVDNLRTTAGSHRRIFVVETMGRTAGWLALKGGESAGAYIILIPEYDFDMEKVNNLILEGRKGGARYDIVIVAEGAKAKGGRSVTRDHKIDAFGHETLGGVGEFVADEISRGTGIETRCVVLSHIQRGGSPCAFDRRMGRYFGIAAVNMIDKKEYGKMVCYKGGKITSVPILSVLGHLSLVDVNTMYDTVRYNGSRSILVD